MPFGRGASMSWWIGKERPGTRDSGLGTRDSGPGTKERGYWSLWSVIFLLIFYFWSPALSAYELTPLKPGLDYGNWSVPKLGNTLHALRIDLNKFSVRPIDARNLGSAALSAKQMGQKTKALAVINANFFDPQNKPLGLILINKKILNPPHSTRWWAALLIKGNRPLIGKVFRKAEVKGFDQGVQAGPRLVVGGHKTRLKDESSPKSVVAIDTQNRLWILATEGNTNINALALYLATPTSRGGLGLQQALNLDGGSSSQFYLKVGKRQVWVPGLIPVPVGLGVFPKESPGKIK